MTSPQPLPMSRFQRMSTVTALAVVAALAAALVGFVVSGVGAQEETIEIHKMASASFEGFPQGPVFIAVVGTDDRPGVSGARADAVHVIGVNPEQRRATVLNIPRDTWTEIPGRGTNKINVSHTFGGAELVGQTLQALTGAPIQYVITTNFEGFTNLVSEVGGVRVNLPYAISDRFSGADSPAGEQTLSGTSALAVARSRKGVPNGDFGRTTNQGRMIVGALGQIRERDPGPAETIQLVATLMRHLKTTSGVDAAELYKLGRLALTIDPANVANVTMPGTTGSAGGASVVLATDAARAVFADFADDAIVESPPPPPDL